MNRLITTNLSKTPASPIRAIFDAVLQLEAKGEDVIRLDIGSPNFKAPRQIIDSINKYMSSDRYQYSSNWGTIELRSALSRWVEDETGWCFNPNSDVIVTNGASEAVSMVIYSLLNNDEEFLIPTPAWPHYIACCQLFNKNYKELETLSSDDFKITPKGLTKAISNKTKALVLNSPCNPTGSIYTEEEFSEIVDVCDSNDITIILDEIYQQLDSVPQKSLLSSINKRENIIYISGFSKAFAMTGFRLGYLMGNKSLTEEMIKYHQYTNVCGQEFVQLASADFINEDKARDQYLRESRDFLSERRKLMHAFLESLPDTQSIPKGAFYAFIEIPARFTSSEEFCLTVLNEQKISLIPGNGFGSFYSNYYRLSYGSVSNKKLRLALEKLASYY